MDTDRSIAFLQKALMQAEAEIEWLRGELETVKRDRDYWHEWFVKADENNSLLANSRVISSSREL